MLSLHISQFRPTVAGVKAFRALFSATPAFRRDDCLYAAFVDAECALLRLDAVKPTSASANVSGGLLRSAVLLEAVGVVFGRFRADPRPTELACEIDWARRFQLASDAVDLCLLDYIVFGSVEHVSFRNRGFLD